VKKLLALAAATAVVAVLAVPAFAATRTVSIGDNYFVHKTGKHKITIAKGTTVKFVWSSKNKKSHNAYQLSPDTEHFHTPNHKKSGSYSHKYSHAGTYKYFCTLHPSMKLTIKVTS